MLGWYQRGWWRVEEDTDCTAKELEVAVEGYFSVDIMDINMNNEKLISEQVRIIYNLGLTNYNFTSDCQMVS